MVGAAGSSDEFAHSVLGICNPRRVLWREPLVDVIVAVENHISVRADELLHHRCGVDLGPSSARPQRDVPVGEQALVAVRGEIAREPASLRARGLASARVAAVRVECDQMPLADVQAVPPLAWRPFLGGVGEVLEIPRGAGIAAVAAGPPAFGSRARRNEVLVVADHGIRLREQLAPREGVGAEICLVAPAVVLRVSEGEHRGGVDPGQECVGGGLLTGAAVAVPVVEALVLGIAGDVSRGGDHGIGGSPRRGNVGRHPHGREQPCAQEHQSSQKYLRLANGRAPHHALPRAPTVLRNLLRGERRGEYFD